MLIIPLSYSQTKKDREHIKKQTNLKRLAVLKTKFENETKATLLKASQNSFPLTKKILGKGGTASEILVLDRIVNGVPFYDTEDNVNAAKTSRVDKIWNGGSSRLNLTGKNIIIGHWEVSGVARATHVELQGKVVVLETASSSSHATHTAGTMVGIGVNPSARGMTSEAIIHARKSNNDEAEMVSFAANGGILSNHSYGTTFDPGDDIRNFGYYSASAREWDQIAFNAPFYLICKSAGNTRNDGVNVADGGYDLLLTKSLAKNILTIGAVKDVSNYTGPSSVTQTSFSSYGPTDDWRIKPDLVNNGQSLFSSDDDFDTDYTTKSGTSMATPTTTGAIALLQQHYHNKNGVYMKSATVKSLLINSADEVGTSDGPDFGNGWGLVNAEKAAEIITNNAVSSLIVEETLVNNTTYEFTFTVDGSNPVTLSIAWTDPAGTPLDATTLVEDQDGLMLVNDLDVRITGNGNTYMPWKIDKTFFQTAATKGDNFRDNVEKIDVASLAAGTYTVKVTHKGQLVNGSQAFSLVLDGMNSSSLSVNENFLDSNISIYPNPVNNKVLFLKVKNINAGDLKVSVFNVSGRLVKQRKVNGNREHKIDVSKLKAGIYFVRITSENNSTYKKVIIQ
jgi:subtilisin family serine protease